MSFSGEVKEELSVLPVKTLHCRRAELAALISALGSFAVPARGVIFLVIQGEKLSAMRRADFLLRSLTGAVPEVTVTASKEWKSHLFTMVLREQEAVKKLLQDLYFLTPKGVLREPDLPAAEQLLKRDCCRRAFLRGAFLGAGVISNPREQYHLEWNCGSEARAEQLLRALEADHIRAKTTSKKLSPSVYVKEAEGLSDCLSLMGAYRSRLELENIRIYRGIQGNVNRRVNCETANIKKTASASVSQADAIRRLAEAGKLQQLPDGLKQMAEARLENPDASYEELGGLLEPPVGKSCVNHRLRRLMELADGLQP